jgi:hypothetical protein
MATGTVSTTNVTPWELVSTVTTTSGTTATFSSLAGYSKYKLCWNGVTTASAGNDILLRFNGNTSNYVSVITNSGSTTTATNGIKLTHNYTTTAGFLNINDVLSTGGPKQVDGVSLENYYPGPITGLWNNTAAITSMVATSGAAYSGGTWTLYGIPA